MEVTRAGASLDQRFDGHVCTTTGASGTLRIHPCLCHFALHDFTIHDFTMVSSHPVVNIEFLTEFGDLPLMRSDLSAIRNIDPHLATLRNGYIMNITEYQKGKN